MSGVFDPSQYGMEPLPYETQAGGMMSQEQAQAELARMRAHAVGNYQPQPQYAPPAPVYMPNARKMQSIERRLMKAQYYRALMDGSLFDIADEVSMEVEREIKDYILSRMEALVGEDPSVQTAKFTDEEIQLLKMWAGALKQKASTASAPATHTATPTVRPVSVPPPTPVVTAPAPQPEAPAAPAAPQVRRKRAPTVRMPATAGSAPAAPVPQAPPQAAPPAPAAQARPPKPGKARNNGPGEKPIPIPQGHYMTSVMESRAAMEVSNPNRVVDTGETVVQVSKQ